MPVLEKQVATPEDIVPNGWEILAQDSGDLNNDDADDAVLILTHSNYEPDGPDTRRLLILLLRDGDHYQVSTVSGRAVLSRFSGGVYGDPYESLKIERGTFYVSHYGGSAMRWGMKHRYRYQDGGWFLIGHTEYTFYRGELKEKDENLVTGDIVERIGDEEGNTISSKKTKVDPAPLIPLEKVDLYHIEEETE